MGEDDSETYNNIARAEFDYEDESFSQISLEAKDFISKLLVKDTKKRMTAQECLNHAWMLQMNSKATYSSQIENDKVINTKNLRRFVIRRRWQKVF